MIRAPATAFKSLKLPGVLPQSQTLVRASRCGLELPAVRKGFGIWKLELVLLPQFHASSFVFPPRANRAPTTVSASKNRALATGTRVCILCPRSTPSKLLPQCGASFGLMGWAWPLEWFRLLVFLALLFVRGLCWRSLKRRDSPVKLEWPGASRCCQCFILLSLNTSEILSWTTLHD